MNTQQLVSEAVSAGLVRRFEPGESGEYIHIQTWLSQRGYVLSTVRHGYHIRQSGVRGAPKRMTWAQVVSFVDGLRVGEGLQPLRRVA